jgi:hypothetical protein
MGDYAFNDCSSLTNITIGNSVKNIGKSAFSGCKNLTGGIVIPNSVTEIGVYAFWMCYKIISVDIGSGVTSIENGAFSSIDSLISVTFQCTISSDNLSPKAFPGDLDTKYLAGGIGTYTRPNDHISSTTPWTKQ